MQRLKNLLCFAIAVVSLFFAQMSILEGRIHIALNLMVIAYYVVSDKDDIVDRELVVSVSILTVVYYGFYYGTKYVYTYLW